MPHRRVPQAGAADAGPSGGDRTNSCLLCGSFQNSDRFRSILLRRRCTECHPPRNRPRSRGSSHAIRLWMYNLPHGAGLPRARIAPMFTMLPCDVRRCGSAARIVRNGAVRLTATNLCQSFSGIVSLSAFSMTPTLLTSTSSLPVRATSSARSRRRQQPRRTNVCFHARRSKNLTVSNQPRSA